MRSPVQVLGNLWRKNGLGGRNLGLRSGLCPLSYDAKGLPGPSPRARACARGHHLRDTQIEGLHDKMRCEGANRPVFIIFTSHRASL